jgi:hypothetical protein
MRNKDERLRIYFNEIEKDGAISSWYLADKYDITRKRVFRDFCFARRTGLVIYPNNQNNFRTLRLNFALTQKGRELIAI